MRLTERGPPSPPPGSRTAESAFDAAYGARTAESAPGISEAEFGTATRWR